MGRLFLVEYDRTPESRFICCRTCEAHLGLPQDCFYRSNVIGIAYFSNTVNYVVDEPIHHRKSDFSTSADIFCTGCMQLLGWTFLESQFPGMPSGTIVLKVGQLQLWNGTQLINVDTIPDDQPLT